MNDKNGAILKVGDGVRVLRDAGMGYQNHRSVTPKTDPFEGKVVGFAGADRVVVEEVTDGPRYSVTSAQVQKTTSAPAPSPAAEPIKAQ